MKENLFTNLEQILDAYRQNSHGQRNCSPSQSFEKYRRSRPARQTAQRGVIYLCRVGELTKTQEAIVNTTADYLSVFFDLPVQPGVNFDPANFPPWGIRQHPTRGHRQLLTDHLLDEVLRLDRPQDTLISLAVTAWDLCSNDFPGGPFGSVFGEAAGGHAAVWPLRYLGNPGQNDASFWRCLKRSCAVASHEALHVLGLEHCTDFPCLMRGSACLSGPLHLCPLCLRKLCWNRQVDLLVYLQRLKDWLNQWMFTEAVEHYGKLVRLLGQ